MADPSKPLPIDPMPGDLEVRVREALRAWGRGEMTKDQQMTALSWIVGDLCQSQAIDPPEMSERLAGYTAGQRRVGMVVSKLTGIRLRLPNERETA